MRFFKDRDEHDMKIVKIVLITAGVVLAVAATTFVVYKIVKKRFKLNFDCDECDFSEDDCLGDDGFAPEFVADAKEKISDTADKIKDAASDIFDELDKEGGEA